MRTIPAVQCSALDYFPKSTHDFKAKQPYVSPFLTGDLFASDKAYRFSGGGGFMSLIQKAMASLQASKFKELVFTDIGFMVTPSGLIEFMQRGATAARESVTRQLSGTIHNSFLSGWFGSLALKLFGAKSSNPKGMDFKAWIDSSMLETLGKITEEVIDKNRTLTPEKLQEEFLKTALGRLQSTDNVPAQYPEYFKGKTFQKRMDDLSIQFLTDRFLGKDNVKGYHHKAYNIEDLVKQKLNRPEIQEELNQKIKEIEEKFKEKTGGGPLSRRQRQQQEQEIRNIKTVFKLDQRKSITQKIRQDEKIFLNRLYEYAVTDGKLTETVFMLNSKGKPVSSVGLRTTKSMLSMLKYFMEEYLNRSLSETGAIVKNDVNNDALKKSLFDRKGDSWLHTRLIPNSGDGLIPYTYKSRYFVTLVPVIMALGVGCSMVYVNNWITRLKNGGKDFFPGEVK